MSKQQANVGIKRQIQLMSTGTDNIVGEVRRGRKKKISAQGLYVNPETLSSFSTYRTVWIRSSERKPSPEVKVSGKSRFV